MQRGVVDARCSVVEAYDVVIVVVGSGALFDENDVVVVVIVVCDLGPLPGVAALGSRLSLVLERPLPGRRRPRLVAAPAVCRDLTGGRLGNVALIAIAVMHRLGKEGRGRCQKGAGSHYYRLRYRTAPRLLCVHSSGRQVARPHLEDKEVGVLLLVPLLLVRHDDLQLELLREVVDLYDRVGRDPAACLRGAAKGSSSSALKRAGVRIHTRAERRQRDDEAPRHIEKRCLGHLHRMHGAARADATRTWEVGQGLREELGVGLELVLLEVVALLIAEPSLGAHGRRDHAQLLLQDLRHQAKAGAEPR